jgi:CheY-like chemotaxis protein
MACILTVDDDENVRLTLRKGLSALGHTVIPAENGRKALRLAFWRKIDVVLLDISMPGMNGLAVLRKLKASSRTQHIPVVMLTGHDDPELNDQARFDYADHFLIKTSSIRDINEKVMAILESIPKLPSGWPTALRW